MTVRTIVRIGQPVLRRAAVPVTDPRDDNIRSLIDDMLETMAHAGGIGLAAPQIGASRRVIVFHVPAARVNGEASSNAAPHVPLTVLINPEIVPLGDERTNAWEACLSIPSLTGLVSRWHHISYRGLGADGRIVEREASGLHARVVQHECDHLDGIVYPQRMADLSSFGFVEEMRRPTPAAFKHPIQPRVER